MDNPTDHLAAVRAAPVTNQNDHLTAVRAALDLAVLRCLFPRDPLRNAAPAIAALADECERLADLFDRIDTAFDQLRPAMADPFVAFVCATMHAAKDPAAPAPALLSDVPMGGDA